MATKRKQETREYGEELKYKDLPGLRHRELIQDRRFGNEGRNLAKFRLRAIQEKAAAMGLRAPGPTPVTPGASNWVQLGPSAIPDGQTYGGARVLVSGRITGIVVDPVHPDTICVAAARGGIWKTTDGGVTWVPKSDSAISLAIGALAMAHSDPNRLYAGTGEGNIFYYAQNFPLNSINEDYHGLGLLRSTDGGDTWTHHGATEFTGAAFYNIAVHPTNPDRLMVATTYGLFRSHDGGATWTAMTNGLPALSISILACCDVLYDPSDANRAWCAFWGSGIYRTTDAQSAAPTWTKLSTGLPSSDISRISLAVAPSNNAVLYAMMASAYDGFKGVFVTPDHGDNWSTAITSNVDVYGAYTAAIAVDIASPDVVYLGGVELYKMVKSGGTWSVTNVGGKIHPDSHALAAHPADHLVIFSGNDGGIYKSKDGGANWDDSINEGLTITQFEFIGQHPTSDTVVIGGTQDNGTEMFRNSPAFYHSADGDGGQAGIDPSNPANVFHTYYVATPERSTQGGKFGTYSGISAGLSGNPLFYPPWTFDESNSANLAFGLDKIQLSASQGTDSWPVSIALPGIGAGRVSAIHYVNSSMIYAATSNGLVYKAVKSGGGAWTATQISTAPLPSRWIWDVALVPGAVDTLVVVMAGYGTPHVWRGTLAGATWTWTDISGTAPNRLPDAPINALQIDAAVPGTMYVGTDVGVYTSVDNGTNWMLFNDGLPNVAVYDIKLLESSRLLRAATHGRGMWERKLDVNSMEDVRLVVRDNIMDTGRVKPSPSGVAAAWEDQLRQVNLNDKVYWWQCADIKTDVMVGGNFQMPTTSVDYLAFETRLAHRDPQRGKVNRVYVQVHNRGALPATEVVVKILFADASPGLPNLPGDFWTAFPGDSGMAGPWTPVGTAKTIPQILPTRPEVVEWDWTPPMSTATHSCMLVVVSCAADPPSTKPLDIFSLVTQNRQAGLKNLHVVGALPSPGLIRLYPRRKIDLFRWTALPRGWSMRLLLPVKLKIENLALRGLKAQTILAADRDKLKRELGKKAELFNLDQCLTTAPKFREGAITGISPVKEGLPVVVSFVPGRAAADGVVHLVHEVEANRIIGGNTFVLRRKPL